MSKKMKMRTSNRESKPQLGGAWTMLRTELESRGLKPRKAFGQNFMVDGNFARAIAAAAAPDERTLILEIGPGAGALTQALFAAHSATRILAIELDRGLASLLRDHFVEPLATGKFTLIEGDVMSDKNRLNDVWWDMAGRISCEENRPRVVVVANLPYNIATPFLMTLCRTDSPNSVTLPQNKDNGIESPFVGEAVVTVQKEAADRLLSDAGSSAYGLPAVLRKLRADGELLRKVGPEIFRPRPQVESAVIRLRFHPWPQTDRRTPSASDPLNKSEYDEFHDFLAGLFSLRRKTLASALHKLTRCGLVAQNPDVALKRFPDNIRAENLRPQELLTLFRSLKDNLAAY